MGKSSIIFASSIFVLILISFISAASVFPVPYDGYVNDFAKIFTVEESGTLRNILQEVRQNTTAEVVIVTVQNIEGYTPSDYALGLATEWKIGKSDIDNGLLILYTLKENKIWVSTGYGIEGILPDSKIGRMLDDYYVPLRDKNKTTQGIINFTINLAEVINQNADELKSGISERKANSDKGWIIFLIILFIFVILPSILRKFAKKKPKSKPTSIWDALFWTWVGSSIGRNSSGGSFGGGFGGGGFGGGGFGGGGAGR